MHMLLINLTTIYQGDIPVLKHAQSTAHTLSRQYLRYTLKGELDTHIENIIKEITTRTNTSVTPPIEHPTTSHPNPQSHDTTSHTHIPNTRAHDETQQETDAPSHTTTDHKRIKLLLPQTQNNHPHNQDTNITTPPRHTLKPPLCYLDPPKGNNPSSGRRNKPSTSTTHNYTSTNIRDEPPRDPPQPPHPTHTHHKTHQNQKTHPPRHQPNTHIFQHLRHHHTRKQKPTPRLSTPIPP
jgi:hypothetical protein